MLPIYIWLKRLVKALTNLVFVIQMILSIIIFLTAGYWLCTLLGINLLSFMQPFTVKIMSLTHMFYHQQAQVGEQEFDGSVLLFDIILLGIIIFLSKVRSDLEKYKSHISQQIDRANRELEDEFNKKLERETQKNLMKYNKFAILIRIKLKSCSINNVWGIDKNDDQKKQQDAIIQEFEKSLFEFKALKVAKSGDNILILGSDFNNIDKYLVHIVTILSKIKNEQRKKRWIVDVYMGLSIYSGNEIKQVYSDMQKLLDLELSWEFLCIGNFCIKYEMNKFNQFTVEKRGHYMINDAETSVWRLVKKI